MIGKLKRWIRQVAQQENPVPSVVAHGSIPIIQVYKITNGYIFTKAHGAPYRDEHPTVMYCATPMDVARQIVNGEVLDKMGIQAEQMSTHGIVSAKLGTQTNPTPTY